MYHLLGNAISKLIIISINFYLAIRLGTNEYGNYSYIQNTMMTLAGVGVMGITSAMTYYFASKKREDAIGLFCSLFFFINVILFFSLFFLKSTIEIISLLCVVSVINYSLISGALIGLKLFKQMAFVNVFSSVFFVLIVFLVNYNNSETAFFLFAFYKFVLCVLCFIVFICYNKLNVNMFALHLLFRNIKEIYTYALPIGLSSLLVGPVIWFGNYYLIKSDNGSDLFGLYSFAYQIYLALIFIPSILSNLYFSYMSGRDNYNILKIGLVVNVISLLIMVLFSYFIMDIYFNYYNNDYIEIKSSMIFFYIAAFIYSISSIIGQKILSEKKVWINFIFNMIWAVSYIILVLLLVPKYNESSLALVLMFSYVIQLLVQVVYLFYRSKHVNVKWGLS